jgi:hypothetical protein
LPRRHKDPTEESFSSLNAIIEATPDILQDAALGIATVAIVQEFLSIYLPGWLVWVAILGYALYSLFKDGLTVLESRKFRIFAIALLTLVVDLYFTFAI